MRKAWNKVKELKNTISEWIDEHETISAFVETFKLSFAYIAAYFAALFAVCKVITFFSKEDNK